VLVIKYVPDELMKKYSEEVSGFYDIEALSDDHIDREIRRLYQKGKRLEGVLAMMESVKGQHPDLMKFYEDRDIIMKKSDLFSTFCSHRRNLIVREIDKKLKKQMRDRKKP